MSTEHWCYVKDSLLGSAIWIWVCHRLRFLSNTSLSVLLISSSSFQNCLGNVENGAAISSHQCQLQKNLSSIARHPTTHALVSEPVSGSWGRRFELCGHALLLARLGTGCNPALHSVASRSAASQTLWTSKEMLASNNQSASLKTFCNGSKYFFLCCP